MSLKNIYIVFIITSVLLGIISCIDDPEFAPGVRNAGKPVMGELKAIDNDITALYIPLKSVVVKANGYPVTERGFAWSTDSDSTKIPENQFQKFDEKGGISEEYIDTIKNLSPAAIYCFWAYAKNEEGIGFSVGVTSRTDDGRGDIRTFYIEENVRATSAVAGGVIERHGEGEIKSRGVYYSRSKYLISKDSVESKMDTDSFTCELKELNPETRYYIQAFVKTSFNVTFEGPLDSLLTTDGRPKVDAVSLIYIGDRLAIVESRVIDQGGASVTERGFCYSTNPDPENGGEGVKCVSAGFGAGEGNSPFAKDLEDLVPRQQYYVCAYVSNRFGKTVSPVTSFQTISDVPMLIALDPNENPNESINFEEGTVKLGGWITDKGKSDIIKRGICYSNIYSKPEDIYLNGKREDISTSNDEFFDTFSGFIGGAKYYVCAYAENNEGVGYSKVVTFDARKPFYKGEAVFKGGNLLKSSPTYFMIEEKAYLLGGDTGPAFTDEFWQYSNDKNGRWNQMLAYPGTSSKWQSVACYGNLAYVLGGLGGDNKAHNEFYYYYYSGNMWYEMPKTTFAPDSAFSRVGCSMVSALYFIGGKKTGTVIDTVKNDVWKYDFSYKKWMKNPDFPVKQYGGISHVINDVAYVGLGKDDSDVCNKTIWMSTDMDTWAVEKINSNVTGGILVSTVYKNKIYVIDEAYRIHEYDPAAKKWTMKSFVEKTSGTHDIHCMYVLNGLIHIGLIDESLYLYNPLWDN